MTQTLYLDADIILDLLARRQPWFKESAAVFMKIQSGEFQGATSVTVFANVFYILRKSLGPKVPVLSFSGSGRWEADQTQQLRSFFFH
ncbi:PIN domain-containing protein [Endozoicomonas sp. SESOKO1]|uniref:PIN domain-containing protein n=1 Tax=Endozoicomonas sp. SESOKO1 TaxID=2828742 RepID=UPI002148B908|nr:PIN domain-containing protein [Endozoicomonas sp. SESOKO1]